MYEYIRVDHPAYDGTGFNEFPHGWREIEGAEFYNRFLTYSPEYQDYRQMYPPGKKGLPGSMTVATLFWYGDKTGIALSSLVEKSVVVGAKYFAFGCKHEWELPIKLANCLYLHKCKLCGYKDEIDSSG